MNEDELSKETTAWYKFVVPAMWLLIAGSGVKQVIAPDWVLTPGVTETQALVTYLLVLALWSWFTWGRLPVKRVSLAGTELHISNFRRTIVVPLAQVTGVRFTRWLRGGPTIHVRFAHETPFGHEIIYLPEGPRSEWTWNEQRVEMFKNRVIEAGGTIAWGSTEKKRRLAS